MDGGGKSFACYLLNRMLGDTKGGWKGLAVLVTSKESGS